MSETKVVVGDYKGSPVLSIFEIDSEGNQGAYPVVSFGSKKAKAILKHLDEIKSWVDNQEKSKDKKD